MMQDILQDNLVTLIAPFYNGEQYLERFLISVIKQTYTNIQFILVNDGSTDNSDRIVERYKTQLTEKLNEFVYLKQENGGAASAVNLALKYVKGEFLCWADCDDELLPENIEKKLLFLNTHKEYGMVNSSAMAIDQVTGKEIKELNVPQDQRKDNFFLQIIEGIPVYPGVFMIRTQLLFNKLDNRTIYYNSEAGQNYQLLLPVAYDNRCGFIDDILYYYYVREDSHSHKVDYRKTFDRTYVREILLDQVLEFVEKSNKKVLMREVSFQSSIQRFNMSFQANDLIGNNTAYTELKQYGISFKMRIKHIIINNNILNKMYRMKG